ncbi:hypothetical protein NM688_g6611 [Phlebia brevispora]|uniref:Uncharacterized protein n=1 Tax=Phlebia brevispora TaxID=194682 RepID=A0ACC1SE87_9APHY|nr:hypothetical protein NM688_g6611 [Phlebia brevispora]
MNPAQVAHGPGLIGAFLNVFLFGIMTTQVYYYVTNYKKDRLWIRIFVLTLLVADCVNSIFDIYWLYTDIIYHFGDASAIALSDWRLATDPATVAIIATSVQMFFAWRVKVLTGNIWITIIVITTAFISLCGGLGTAIAIPWVGRYSLFYRFDQVATVWLIATAICDTVIALSLTWYLRKHKTGVTSTDDILDKLSRLTVQNGAITAVWAIVDLILFLTIPTGVHLAMNLPLAKLYTNSLMSSLNSRDIWKFHGNSAESEDARAAKSGPMPEFLTLSMHTQTRPEVMVHVEQHEMIDIEAERETDVKWSEHSTNGEDVPYKPGSVV